MSGFGSRKGQGNGTNFFRVKELEPAVNNSVIHK